MLRGFSFTLMKEEIIHIVISLDRGYVMPSGVMMRSVCVNNPDLNIQFHIVTDTDVAVEDCDDLAAVVAPYHRASVRFYRITEQILENSFPKVDKAITRASYFRLYLTDILPASIDKVLYLDGDLIVRHSLKELWDVDLSGYALAAVPDMREATTDRFDGLGYSRSLGYFNAGVLLINLAYWRRHEAIKIFGEFLRDRWETIRFHDQDVLNYVFREQKVMLPIKFNLQDGYLWETPEYDCSRYEEEVIEARKDPVIVHFAGEIKPWKYSCSPNPFRSTFFKYQKMTKWKGVSIDERSNSMKVRNFFGDILRWMRILPHIGTQFVRVDPID